MSLNNPYSYGWRDRRQGTGSRPFPKRSGARGASLFFWAGAVLGAVLLLFFAGTWIYGMIGPGERGYPDPPAPGAPSAGEDHQSPEPFALDQLNWSSAQLSDRFVLDHNGSSMTVESTLDPGLQNYITDLLGRSQTLQAAVVVVRPDDGRVLAMVSYDKNGNGDELCLKADFPAASLFKIVAAAAALETAGFTPQKPVYYNGRKYTLYKQQLKQQHNRYTRELPFMKAFGLSINPVFGKLGIYNLGRERMTACAEKFYFNQTIPFDLPLQRSVVEVLSHEFGLAEIASGFNKMTRISPLHAALLAATVANDGIMMKPWLIKRVFGENSELLYQNEPERLGAAMTRHTAQNMKTLMQSTVTSGTCRRTFWKIRQKKCFRGVEMGAKTGTINDRTDRFKYDWLTAFVLGPDREKVICLSVMGVHGKRLGIRANMLGQYIIDHYFSS
ncbi:MAG: penicillin-binding transpeptidase domain-containing protein [Desulfobacteraceae bacterium]